MFALSLVDFPSLLLSPSTYFKIFFFVKSIIWRTHTKSTKNFMLVWNLNEVCRTNQYWLSCERLAFEVFLSCLFDGPLGIAYANMLATTQWPLERAANLTSFVWVCVLWLPESLMGLSMLWEITSEDVRWRICAWFNWYETIKRNDKVTTVDWERYKKITDQS